MKKLFFLLGSLVLAACSNQSSPQSAVYESTYGSAFVYGKDSTEYEKFTKYVLQAVIQVDGKRTLTEMEVPKRVYKRYAIGDSIPSVVY